MVGQILNDQRLSLMMKILSCVCGFGMIILGIMVYVYYSDIKNFVQFIMALYFMIFGVLGMAAEFPVKYISRFFSFMKKYFGKGLYFIFMGTISFSVTYWWQIIISLLNIMLGILYIVFHFKLKDKLIEEGYDVKEKSEEPAREAAPPSQV
ncbi:unnamed protein product [Blepharisma stoltei]|uniref:COPI associated protein n=1 Tax=Blepharisma stoltei TaxID=1481888 RepID=A0AAU9KNZ0_9CILI|nr:unnamed protein product [Blepharisma stoltei]